MMNHPKLFRVYVGLDIHRQTHTATVINCFGETLGCITFQNKPSEFEKLLKEVKKHISSGITPTFGLEDVYASGRALAVFLLGKNMTVKYVNPSLTYSERHNQTILNKTDEYDSLCVARVLLSKFDELPDANPQDIYFMLSQLMARRNAIVKACVALKNQAHSYLIHNYPSYRSFFTVFDCKTSLEFFEKYPSPSKLEGVTVKELGKFLGSHSRNFHTEEKANQILESVDTDGDTKTNYQDIRDFMIVSCIRQLKGNYKELKEIDSELKRIVPLFGYKLESMNGINYVTAASLIAEIGDIHHFHSADSLAKYAGIAPVRYSSGKTDKLLCNALGDRKLNNIFFNIAVTVTHCAGGKSKPINEYFYNYYRKKLSEGKTKKQGLKCVMRRLVSIIYSMMKNKSEYRNPILSNPTQE